PVSPGSEPSAQNIGPASWSPSRGRRTVRAPCPTPRQSPLRHGDSGHPHPGGRLYWRKKKPGAAPRFEERPRADDRSPSPLGALAAPVDLDRLCFRLGLTLDRDRPGDRAAVGDELGDVAVLGLGRPTEEELLAERVARDVREVGAGD